MVNDKGKKLFGIRVTLPNSIRVEYVKAFTPTQAIAVLKMRLTEQEAAQATLTAC